MWFAFRFCIFVLWTQFCIFDIPSLVSCELLSDFVYSFFEHNTFHLVASSRKLWIAFRFCIFVLWTQSVQLGTIGMLCCELLSDFVYSFFEHNGSGSLSKGWTVVNCFQILYIRSLNTIWLVSDNLRTLLWIAFRFCIFVLWTQCILPSATISVSCELLSDFVYSFFEHNHV